MIKSEGYQNKSNISVRFIPCFLKTIDPSEMFMGKLTFMHDVRRFDREMSPIFVLSPVKATSLLCFHLNMPQISNGTMLI